MKNNDLHSKEDVYNFLQGHALGVLSTVSPDGTPYASPIYFITDKELNFFFVTKSDTKKAQNIAQNNHAALTITQASPPITIQATGTIGEAQEPEIFAKIADAYAKEKGEFSWPPPLSKLQSEGYLLMYKFIPTWLRVGDFSEFEDVTEIQKNIFRQIIPTQST
jgi:uncharacterized pyridoxamine 5'-phosphate oxidase family protein